MLNKIILCLTETYENRIKGSQEFVSFLTEMEKHKASVEFCDFTKKDCMIDKKETALYLSDDESCLSFLQEQGCYTIAVYHEGVSGLLSGTKHAIEGLKDIEWEYLYKVYQRFAKIPWEITETARCRIREMDTKDVDALYELYSSPQVTKYIEDLFTNKEEEIRYIQDYKENVYEYYGFGTWLIFAKEEGSLIGRAGFNYRPGFEEVELGFVIGEPYWRKGYAYEVCSHLMEIGKCAYEFEKVQALVKKENEASKGLLKKLGFIYIEDILWDGEEYQRYLS